MINAKGWAVISLIQFLFVVSAFGQTASSPIPHLQKRGNVTQLIVDGKPFLILGGELANSSASSLSYMQPIWPKLAAMQLNTVLVPVSWELIEPEEGKFDFALVDGLIDGAREYKLRLVLLWFGSWKNTYSSYVPEWVKRDTKRFPRVLLRDGRPTERLSAFSEVNRKADAKAFAELMKHIAEADESRTVIMVQVENEVGVIPQSRDFSPNAETAFRGPVPPKLMDHLRNSADTLAPELRHGWTQAGKKRSGSWQEVFGPLPITDDFFMAWQYATYIDDVVAAGKAQHPLPMFTNAALIRPNYEPGQYNSGGPLPHSMDIYRVAAPHLDFISPDIYFENFALWAGKYQREGNPVFVPEARGGEIGAANAYYAFGQLSAIGFSPFDIDGDMTIKDVKIGETRQWMTIAYSELAHLAPLILEKQGTPDLGAVVLEGEAQRAGKISLAGYEMAISRAKAGSSSHADQDRAAVLFARTRPDEFLVAGSGALNIVFLAASDGPPIAGIASIDEEVLLDGKWILQRRLNGDENAQGQILKLDERGAETATVYKVRLYRY